MTATGVEILSIRGSSRLTEARYDYDQRELVLTFTDARRYRYDEVPDRIYAGLSIAPSKGKYFDSHIRDVYQTTEI